MGVRILQIHPPVVCRQGFPELSTSSRSGERWTSVSPLTCLKGPTRRMEACHHDTRILCEESLILKDLTALISRAKADPAEEMGRCRVL
jgi:hypothetical protein